MCSFLSAIPWGRAFLFIYNIRKSLGFYFCFLREFAIFVGNFSNLGEFSRKFRSHFLGKQEFPLRETHFPQQGLAICVPPW